MSKPRDLKSMRQPMTPRQIANVLRLRAHELRYAGRNNDPEHEDKADEIAMAVVREEFKALADLFDKYDDVDQHGVMNAKADRVKRGEEKESWER